MNNREAVLLDLDGTLLPMDIDDFLRAYFTLLTKEFSAVFPADEFINNIMYATDKMIKNNGDSFNNEVFIEEFFNIYQVEDPEKIMKQFDKFYKEKFPLLESEVDHQGLAVRLIDRLKDKGYRLVIATNPIFPLEAIKERLRWVNLDPDDFELITNYENMHYCKPNINYYKEIAKKLDINPEKCLMIGNDVQEDMIAGQIGMGTYLVTDFLIDRNEDIDQGEDIDQNGNSDQNDVNHFDWQGSFEDLVQHFQRM